jgi:hypothetical protein
MIEILYTTDHDNYYPMIFLFSDDKACLDSITKSFELECEECWSLQEEWPKVLYKIVENNEERWFGKYKYWQYVAFGDVKKQSTPEEMQDVLDMLKQENLALLHLKSENTRIKIFAEAIVRGVIDTSKIIGIETLVLTEKDNMEVE